MVARFDEPALTALFDRFSEVQWLRPDLSMSALDDEARGFIDDRIDQHFSSLSSHSAAVAERRFGGARVHRSLYDARFDCGYFGRFWWCFSELAPVSPEAVTWVRALDEARRTTLSRARATLGSDVSASIVERALAVARGRAGRDATADEQLIQRLRSRVHDSVIQRWPLRRDPSIDNARTTALALCGQWIVCESLCAALGERRSPWAPLIDLWERGVAPLAATDGAFVVYVPFFERGALVADPDPSGALSVYDVVGRREASDETHALWRQCNAYFDAGHRFKGTMWQEPAVLALWAWTHRFARHGFAPLPSMTLQSVHSAPESVATNTPPSALSTYLPRQPVEPMTAARFDAMIDEPDTDEALLERATAEGLVRRPSSW